MKLSIYKVMRKLKNIYLLLTIMFCVVSVSSKAQSSFGEYRPSQEYSQYTRSSQYISVADGTKLAVDVFRPAVNGQVETKPLPVIFYYGRYWRAKQLADGTIMTNLGPWQPGQKIGSLVARDNSGRLLYWDTGRESIANLMSHGYVFVRAESRGTGASEGISQGDHALGEARDGADLIKWIGDQPWSTGKVGMIGGSYHGMTQLKIAALAPPELKAIFPAVPIFDLYQLATGGSGLLHKGILSFGQGQAEKDGLSQTSGNMVSAPKVAPVDNDMSSEQLKSILEYRKLNSPPNALFSALQDVAPDLIATMLKVTQAFEFSSPLQALELMMVPPRFQKALEGKPELQQEIAKGLHIYRDTAAFSNARDKGLVSPSAVMNDIQKAAIPMYIWTGWYDEDTIGAFNLFNSFTGPKKLTSGVWSHGPNEDNGIDDNYFDGFEAEARELLSSESLRWFDYWLKGIDNGVMAEDAIHYSYSNSDKNLIWNSTDAWPLSETSSKVFYFNSLATQVDSVDDGTLSTGRDKAASLKFTVDYTKTTGPYSRFHDSMSSAPSMVYPNMIEHARGEGALTFTSAALTEDTLVVGHPVLNIYANSTAVDGEIFAYLEEVDAEGNALYLTEGVVRASHRKLVKIANDTLGVPIPSSTRADVSKTSAFTEGVTELKFALQPTANLFEKGNRIRLVITGADMHNYLAPVFSPSPELTISFGGKQASSLTLPIFSAK